MNMWIIMAVIGLLVIGAFVAVTTVNAKSAEKISCSGCNNSCTADKNCGNPDCGAVQGKTCGCGR